MKRNRHLIVLLFAFLFMSSCLNPFQFMAQGRQFPDVNLRKEEMAVKMRVLLGSRPPRCGQRCSNCGHCEAVQVPITPAVKFLEQNIYSAPTIAYSRDGISNYKPMCWKCKCGDVIFNP